jgi:di/tripeptidase
MKSFKDYLVESIEAKKYEFKIKIAGVLPEHCEDVMENALKKYDLAKFAKSKTVPIQAKVPDFPTMENVEVTVFDVELNYPTTGQVLSTYMAEQTGIPADRIRVRSPLEEAEIELNATTTNEETKDGKPLIGQCDPAPSNNQKLAGDKYVASFLKELSKTRKEPEQYKGVNDSILAKKSPKEKAAELVKASPAKSPISGKGKTK